MITSIPKISTNFGEFDMFWHRIPCAYKNKNLLVRVEEWSQKPYYLALKFLYQGGQTEITRVEIAEVSFKTDQHKTNNTSNFIN